MRIEFIPKPDATPDDFKALSHDYGLANYLLTKSVKCSVNLSHSILADLSNGEPPRPRKMQLDDANRRIEIDLQPDVLDVVELLRIITPPDIVQDVLVEGVSIYQHWEELDGEEFAGGDKEE